MSLLRRVVALWSCGFVVAAVAGPAAPRQALATRDGSPIVQAFVLERVAELKPGVELAFSVFGTERSEVTVYIQGIDRLVDLREAGPGVYEGSVVLGTRDRPRPDSDVVATMVRDGRVTRASLGEPLVLASTPLPWAGARAAANDPPPRPPPADGRPVPPIASERIGDAVPMRACVDCAVVDAIRTVQVEDRSALSQAFDSHRQRVLGLLDALGVPGAARERERIGKRPTVYEVLLRRADGRVEVRHFATRPAFEVGDSVRLSDPDSHLPVPSV